MRLHQARHRKLDWRRGKKISPVERLVTWAKPSRQPLTSELTAAQWAALPEEVFLRYIKLGYEDRAGKKSVLVVVIDLPDPEKYQATELADLYARRWGIEVKLRDVKTTLGMEFFAVKTPKMAHKTLWMKIIAYNLMRILMQQSAHEAGEPVHHVSLPVASPPNSWRRFPTCPGVAPGEDGTAQPTPSQSGVTVPVASPPSA